MLNDPFPEYVYNAQGARNYLKTKFEIDNEIDTRADLRTDCIKTELFEFTKAEINSVRSYLRTFCTRYISDDLAKKLKMFGAYTGSDIFFYLPRPATSIDYIGHYDLEQVKSILESVEITDELVRRAIRFDNIEMILYLREKIVDRRVNEWNHFLEEAIKYKSTKIMNWILENKCDFTHDSLNVAIEYYNLDVMNRLFTTKQNHSSSLVFYAIRGASLDSIKWLHEKGYDFYKTIDSAALHGHFEIIKWLHENTDSICTVNAINYAAQNGHLEIVKWLHENRNEGFTRKALEFAVNKRQADVISWFVYETKLFDESVLIDLVCSASRCYFYNHPRSITSTSSSNEPQYYPRKKVSA